MIIKAPYDNLRAVTQLIALRKMGYTIEDLAIYFGTSHDLTRRVLMAHGLSNRGIAKSHAKKLVGRYGDTIDDSDTVYLNTTGKYDKLIFEPINGGKNYDEYLKEQGIVIPQNTSFDRIRRFKEKKQPD